MDIQKFWKMIETAREAANGNIETQLELLVGSLSKESDEDIIRFDQILRDMIARAYRANLRDACDFINCWCSDEEFSDFRAWLVAQGEDIFERAIENPDSLVDTVDVKDRRFVMYESFTYVGSHAYERKNDKELPNASPQFAEHIGEYHERDEEELSQLFPALNAKLGSCSESWQKYRDKDSNAG
jgi:hypothetical protein